MDVEKVQKIITWLAKSGDKETLSKVAQLLTEVSNYKGKSETKEVVKAPKNVNESISHASSLLDGSPSSYTIFTPKEPSYERSSAPSFADPTAILSQYVQPEHSYTPPMSSDIPYEGGSRILANNKEMTSHADMLL